MKNIAICADGTGNTAIKGRGTNVFKLYEAIDQAGHRLTPDPEPRPQVALYHDGVGTESVKWLRAVTGAIGWGLSRNVKQLYGELARVYAPGDKIFLFGFSRGAFTVRTLAGLIHACGILDLSKYSTTNAIFNQAVNDAYREYRKKYNAWLTNLFHRTEKFDDAHIRALRARFSVPIPEFQADPPGRLIEFIGVWDTVDAVGLPIVAADVVNRTIYAFKFPDRTLSVSVAHACHALALDEERDSFKPVLWDESQSGPAARIEQVWFAGVHSNVGGGYPRPGMSLVALDWIMTRAETRGLRFVPAERLYYRFHADVDDKLYDSRAGLGVFYRWKPRNIQRICDANGTVPRVHRSVFERTARSTEGYAPGSISTDPEVVSTTQPLAVTDAVRALVRKHHGDGGPLLEREARTLGMGTWSYRIFVYSIVAWALLTVKAIVSSHRSAADAGGGWEVAGSAFGTITSFESVGFLLDTLCGHPWLIFTLALGLGLGLWVDRRLDRTYSQFWHAPDLQLKLRKLMGLG